MRNLSFITNLLNLSKSASFVFVVAFCFTNCNEILANQNESVAPVLYLGPPTTANNGGGTGTTK